VQQRLIKPEEKNYSKATHMAENYLFYSSAALFIMGSLSLVISLVFRWKSKKVDGFADELRQTVFDKTFVVFSPYEDRTKLIHKLVSFIPWIAMFASFGFALLALLLISSGLLLTVIVTIISLNFIILEEAAEAYQFSNLFIRAAQHRTDLGVGDLKLVRETRRVLPKLSTYYLVLTILFLAFALSLQIVWPYLAATFFSYSAIVLNTSSFVGTLGPMLVLLLLALTVFTIQIFAHKAKNKYFQTSNEPSLQ
jgi:hypothetical protein